MLIGLFFALKNAADTYYSSSIEGEDKLEEVNLKQEAFLKQFKDRWGDSGKVVADVWEGLKDKWRSLIKAIAPDDFAAQADKIEKIAESTARLQAKLFKDHIQDVVDDGVTEIKVNEDLEKSKDKLHNTDKERLDALREANKLLEDQAEGDLQLAKLDVLAQKGRIIALGGVLQQGKLLSQYTYQEIEAIGVKKEEIKKLADLEVAELKITADASAKRKSLLKAEIALVEEIAKAKRDALYRQVDSQREIDEFILNESIKNNQEQLKDETLSLNDRLKLINDIGAEKIQLLGVQQAKELDVIQRAAEDRIRAEGREPNEKILAMDVGYQNQRKLILDKYVSLVKAANDEGVKAADDNYFKVLQRDSNLMVLEIDKNTNEALTDLNDQLAHGLISAEDYNKEKIAIQKAFERESLQSQLAYLREQVAAVKDNSTQKAELLDKISKLELQLSGQSTQGVIDDAAKKKKAEEDVAKATIQLQQASFAFAKSLVDSGTQERLAALDQELNALSDQKDKELALVGNDAQAKARIDENYRKKQAVINQQILAEKRKQAIFDKAISATQTVVNTARAVVEALPNIPLAFLVGAIGALQLATILTTPIPAFAKGTDDAPEGHALVGEKGREIGYNPRTGKAKLYDVPQITYLEKGMKIFNNMETERIISAGGDSEDVFNLYRQSKTKNEIVHSVADSARIVSAIDDSTEKIVSSLERMPQDVHDESGYHRYIREKNTRIERLDRRYRLGG